MHVALEVVRLIVNLLTAFKLSFDVWQKMRTRTR